MDATELLADLTCAGISVEVGPERLIVGPAALLTDTDRAAIRSAKPKLMALLTRAEPAGKAIESLARRRLLVRKFLSVPGPGALRTRPLSARTPLLGTTRRSTGS